MSESLDCITFKLSMFTNFKALFPAVTMDIGLLVFIKTLKNPMERSIEAGCVP